MIRRMVIVIVVLMLFFASSVLGAKMIQKQGRLLVDFKDKEFIHDIRVNEAMIKDAYILQDGVIYVPLKKVVLTLHEAYQYSKKDNWVVVTTSKEKFKMLLNSSQYYVGKKEQRYKTDSKRDEVKPIFIKGRIYAPLQFIEEIFSVKQVGKTLYIENKTNLLEVETDIQKEVLTNDETEQPLENTMSENKIDEADENEDQVEESTSSESTTSTLNSNNTTKKKNKKKKNSSTQSNIPVQEQQNLPNTNESDNNNQRENNSENVNENINDSESENNSENVNENINDNVNESENTSENNNNNENESENVNDNEDKNNSESNTNNEDAVQEPVESTSVDQENTLPFEIDSKLKETDSELN